MAFTPTYEGELKMPPARTDKNEAGPIFMCWGTFTNTGASTGGEINPPLDDIYTCNAMDEDNAAAIRVQPNISAAGRFTITTTADASGTWWAIGKRRRSK